MEDLSFAARVGGNANRMVSPFRFASIVVPGHQHVRLQQPPAIAISQATQQALVMTVSDSLQPPFPDVFTSAKIQVQQGIQIVKIVLHLLCTGACRSSQS